jgi:hypothetical protein
MMKKTILALCTLVALLGTAACSLKEIFEKKEKLPDINSETSKAFGFLLNGKVWLPKGSNSYPRYQFSVDPSFADGVLDILVHRYPNDDGSKDGYQSFRIGGSLKSVGLYPIKNGERQTCNFYDLDSNCEYSIKDSTCQFDGYLKVTTYDLDKGRFQGEFEVKISKPGCETLNITKGRFVWQY